MSQVVRNFASFVAFLFDAFLRDEPVPDQRVPWTDGTD